MIYFFHIDAIRTVRTKAMSFPRKINEICVHVKTFIEFSKSISLLRLIQLSIQIQDIFFKFANVSKYAMNRSRIHGSE